MDDRFRALDGWLRARRRRPSASSGLTGSFRRYFRVFSTIAP
jgi:hypothetical protein